MSTSEKGGYVRSTVLWGTVSILTALFAAGYEQLSHGVISAYMVGAFLVPLLLGSALSALLLALSARPAGDWCAALWELAVGVLTVGSLVQGALEIYGTANQLMIVYPVTGGALMLLAALSYFRGDREE